ncbi:MAG: signal recognition particle protein [Pseudomonadota bacterium]|nr:signal recognition particle protein [Pseudomonadota bacterium]
MFNSLSEKLRGSLANIRGKSKLTEENIDLSVREVRMALLEADVSLSVVKKFLSKVRNRAIGQEVSSSLTPGQVFLKIVNEELVRVMGEQSESLSLNAQPPAVVLLAGLQGAGKTTSAAKLAHWLRNREKKKVMLASTDVYRPAAIDQLKTLAQDADVTFFESKSNRKPLGIAREAVEMAGKHFTDVLIIDTAGRLHVDSEMMSEIQEIQHHVSPVETLFVVDAMTGQDAANTAKAFNELLPLTGIILTKVDGDARGGAALSVREITGRPIKFMAVGEGIEQLEAFHPERVASRILGMGDILSFIEEVEQKVDKKKAKKLERKLKKGKKFDLDDFQDQISQMNRMGGLDGLLDKIPGMGNVSNAMANRVNEQQLIQMEAIMSSMTPGERHYPDSINGSRKKRIAGGSGTQIQDVNRLLKQYKQMQKMMKRLSKKGGMANMMRGLEGLNQSPSRFNGR